MVEEAGAAALDGAGLVRPAASDASQQFSEFLRRALIQLHTIELARLHGDFSDRITDTFFRFAAADPLQSNQPGRSEEHTSELQSLMRISYAVFCLKKKKHITSTQQTMLA